MAPRPSDGTGQVLSFAVADRQFGLPARDVLEVQRTPRLTRVPNGSPSLAGLMNYHGAAIAVVRMSTLLAVEGAAADQDGRVVVYAQEPPVALLVDRVTELAESTAGGKSILLDLPQLLAREFVARPAAPLRLGLVEGAADPVEPAEESVALLAFRVASQRYALPLEAISEVMVLPDDVSILPRSAATALGMLEHRGAVLPLLSVAGLLGLSADGARQHVLITDLGGTAVGLVVGAVDGVIAIAPSSIEPVPAILQRGSGDAELDGIARLGRDRQLVAILSPEKLLQNHDVAEAMDRSTSEVAAMAASDTETVTEQFVVFRLGEETYGLPIGVVDEIVQLPEKLTRVPGAPDFVAGVMSLRGRALPLIDQRQRFQSGAPGRRGRVIVTTVGELQAGFIVDSVSEILRVPASDVSAAPGMPGEGVEVFDRVAATEAGMVLVVDPQALLDRAERDMLRAFNPAEGQAASP